MIIKEEDKATMFGLIDVLASSKGSIASSATSVKLIAGGASGDTSAVSYSSFSSLLSTTLLPLLIFSSPLPESIMKSGATEFG